MVAISPRLKRGYSALSSTIIRLTTGGSCGGPLREPTLVTFALSPAPEGTLLTLVTWLETMPPGSLQGLVVATDDIQETYEQPASRGVPFDFPPTEMPGGTQAVFRDPDGNGLVLSERP